MFLERSSLRGKNDKNETEWSSELMKNARGTWTDWLMQIICRFDPWSDALNTSCAEERGIFVCANKIEDHEVRL